MAVFSNPSSPEQEDEYNAWYNDMHLKELVEVPGVVGATRYKLAEGAGTAPSEHRYLAVYEVERDPAAVLGELGSRAGSMTMSPTIDTAGTRIVFWAPLQGGSVVP
jgi:hypothetical protein